MDAPSFLVLKLSGSSLKVGLGKGVTGKGVGVLLLLVLVFPLVEEAGDLVGVFFAMLLLLLLALLVLLFPIPFCSSVVNEADALMDVLLRSRLRLLRLREETPGILLLVFVYSRSPESVTATVVDSLKIEKTSNFFYSFKFWFSKN